MKALKTFIKPFFEVQERKVKIKIYMKSIFVKSLGTLGMGRVKFL